MSKKTKGRPEPEFGMMTKKTALDRLQSLGAESFERFCAINPPPDMDSDDFAAIKEAFIVGYKSGVLQCAADLKAMGIDHELVRRTRPN